MTDENKWNFTDEFDDCNAQRASAIIAEAEAKVRETSAAGGDQAAVAEANAKASVEVARVTAQAQASAAESQCKEAKAVAKWRAREADWIAQGHAREAEAAYAWVHGFVRIIRILVIGAVLSASFYFTPSFWPDVVKSITTAWSNRNN